MLTEIRMPTKTIPNGSKTFASSSVSTSICSNGAATDMIVMLLQRDGLAIFAPNTTQAITNFSNSRECLDAIKNARQGIFSSARGFFQFSQRRFAGPGVAFIAQGAQSLDLGFFNCRVDPQSLDARLFITLKAIYADDDRLVGFHGPLILVSRVLNFALDIALFDGPQGAAHRVNLVEIINHPPLDLVGEFFDRIRAGQRIYRVGNSRFEGNNLLSAQGQARRILSRQRQRFVHRVRVERLRAA